jgi:hypothetical protein
VSWQVSEERVESCCALLKHLLQGQLVAAHNLAADDAASAAPARGDKKSGGPAGGRGGGGRGSGGRGGGGRGGRGGSRVARAVTMEVDSSEEGEEPPEGEGDDDEDAEKSFGSLSTKSPKSGTPKAAQVEGKGAESARPLQRAVLRLCETGGVADLMEKLGALVTKVRRWLRCATVFFYFFLF